MKLIKILTYLTLGFSISFGALASGEVAGKVPDILSLTVEDYKPDGCMACHKIKQIKGKTVDHRLITKPDMQAVDVHREDPDFAKIQTIPGDEEQGCVSCHGDFADLMHQKHFNNPTPEESLYITKYYGKVGCMGCHAFENDEDYGLGMIMKQGKVNWTPEEFKALLEKAEE